MYLGSAFDPRSNKEGEARREGERDGKDGRGTKGRREAGNVKYVGKCCDLSTQKAKAGVS